MPAASPAALGRMPLDAQFAALNSLIARTPTAVRAPASGTPVPPDDLPAPLVGSSPSGQPVPRSDLSLDEQFAQLEQQLSNGPTAPSGTSAAPVPRDLTDRLARLTGRVAGPWGQAIVRDAGIGVRGALEGLQHVVNAPADAANAVYQLATNPAARRATLASLEHPSLNWLREPSNAPSSITSRALGKVFPTAQNGPEKALAFTTSVLGAGDTALGRAADLAGASDPFAAARQARVASRAARVSRLTGAQEQAAQGGRDLGMRLTPGQSSGSGPLQRLEARLESSPWTSGPLDRLKAGNARALGRVAAQSIGEPGNSVDAAVLGRAADRLGDVFENVRNGERPVEVDPAETTEFLKDLDSENEGLLPNDMSIRDNNLVRQFARLTKAEEPAAAAPSEAPAEGYTRLYRGEKGPQYVTHPSGPSVWFSDELPVAENFARMSGNGGPVTHLDVPTSELENYRNGPNAFGVPSEIAARRVPISAQAAATEGEPATVTAKQLGQLSSKLGKAAYKQMTTDSGDRDLGQALYAVKEHVDDLLEKGLEPDERAEYASAREQYRNLMHLVRRGVANPSTGNVSGAGLANRLASVDRRGFTFGKNQSPLYRAARFAQAFKPIVGDSGTATRSAPLGILPGLGLALAGHAMGLPLGEQAELGALPLLARGASNLASRAYLTRPGAALVRGALEAPGAAARGAGRVLTNPGTYAALPRPAAPLLLPVPLAAAGLVHDAHQRHAQSHGAPEVTPGQWAALVLDSRNPALLVHHGFNKFTTIYPPNYPGASPQRFDGILPKQ